MDYFELLTKKLIKPIKVYNCGNTRLWKNAEKSERVIFPNDYKRFIDYYGTGGIDNFFWILTPFETDENVNFKIKSKIILEAYMELKKQFPEDYIYDIFPNERGILPCAYTENGDEVYWLTSKDEKEWEIVLYDSVYSEFRHYNMGFVEFLYKIVIGDIENQLIKREKEKCFCSIKV